jgi:hypothetical protein
VKKKLAGNVTEQYLQKYCENNFSRLLEDTLNLADTPKEAIEILSGESPASLLLKNLQRVLQHGGAKRMYFWNTSDLVYFKFLKAGRRVYTGCTNLADIIKIEKPLLETLHEAGEPTKDLLGLLQRLEDQRKMAWASLPNDNDEWRSELLTSPSFADCVLALIDCSDETFLSSVRHRLNSEADAQRLVYTLLRAADAKRQVSKKTTQALFKLFRDVESREDGPKNLGLRFLSGWILNKLAGVETWNIRQLWLDQMSKKPESLKEVTPTLGKDEQLKTLEVIKQVRNYYHTRPLSPKDVLEAASIELGELVDRPAVSSEAAACPVERVLLAQMTLEKCCTEDKVKQVQQIYPSMSVEAMVQGMYDGKDGMKFARLVQLLRQPEFKKYRHQVKSLTSKRKFKDSTDETARKKLHNLWGQRLYSYLKRR